MIDPVQFGRAMMSQSPMMKDDADCNAFARVGSKLINLGEPGYPRTIYDLSKDDFEVISKALSVLSVTA